MTVSLGTYIHHVTGHCCKDFQGHSRGQGLSEVKKKVARDAISLYLVDGVQWNVPRIISMWAGVAGVWTVRRRGGSRVWPDYDFSSTQTVGVCLRATSSCEDQSWRRRDWHRDVVGKRPSSGAVKSNRIEASRTQPQPVRGQLLL